MREVFREESEARRKALVREAYGREQAVRAFEALGGQAAALREAAAALERAARSAARRREDAGFAAQRLPDSTPEAADAGASGTSAFVQTAKDVIWVLSVIKDLSNLRGFRVWKPKPRAPVRGGSSAGSGGSVILGPSGRPITSGGGGVRRPAPGGGNTLQIAGGKIRGFAANAGGRIPAGLTGAGAAELSKVRGFAANAGGSGQLLAGGGRIARQLAGTFGRANLLGAGIAAFGALPTLLDDEASGAEKAQAAGGAAGLLAGGMAGAKLGALAGAFGGPFGAAVGGVLGGAAGSFLGETALQSAADAIAGFLDFGGGGGDADRSAAPAPFGGLAPAEALPAAAAAGMFAASPGFRGEASRPAVFDAPPRGRSDAQGGTIIHAQQYGGVYVRELIINQQPGEDPHKLADRIIEEIEKRAAQARRDALYDID